MMYKKMIINLILVLSQLVIVVYCNDKDKHAFEKHMSKVLLVNKRSLPMTREGMYNVVDIDFNIDHTSDSDSVTTPVEPKRVSHTCLFKPQNNYINLEVENGDIKKYFDKLKELGCKMISSPSNILLFYSRHPIFRCPSAHTVTIIDKNPPKDTGYRKQYFPHNNINCTIGIKAVDDRNIYFLGGKVINFFYEKQAQLQVAIYTEDVWKERNQKRSSSNSTVRVFNKYWSKKRGLLESSGYIMFNMGVNVTTLSVQLIDSISHLYNKCLGYEELIKKSIKLRTLPGDELITRQTSSEQEAMVSFWDTCGAQIIDRPNLEIKYFGKKLYHKMVNEDFTRPVGESLLHESPWNIKISKNFPKNTVQVGSLILTETDMAYIELFPKHSFIDGFNISISNNILYK
eukprot:GHVR01024971.1.p1 GENE.GHVR01024971.1~~GHVR01024971.1.p1  ORF type:complete len:414 (+),score=66.42 GHVR01024971.1:42-1244(+)